MSFHHDSDTGEIEPPQREEAREKPAVVSVELDDVLRRRHSRRQRVARIGTLAAAALLAAALVLHAAGARITLPQTPTPQRPVGVALVSNISFGALTLNGRRLGGPPPQAVALREGTNVITLTAPPFQTRECRVTWPDLTMLSGRCTVSVGFGYAPDSALDVEYMITLDYDGGDLPPDAAAAARATVNAAILSARLETTVPAGQLIATGWTPRTGAIATMAAPPLTQARLSFAPAATLACPSGLCAGSEFNPSFPGSAPPAGPAWMLNAGITYTWRFVTHDGASLGSVTYPSDAPVSFAITPDDDVGSSWHVWQPAPPALPGVVQSALVAAVCDWASVFRVGLPGMPSPAGVSTTIGPNIQGCLLDLQAPDGAHTGTLIWRFGVLLAADDPAHAHYSTLPLAPAGAVQAVSG